MIAERRSSIHLPSLLWTLVRTDFKLRYHGSLGGLFWALLRPVSVYLILQAVFSIIFSAQESYRLNLLIGLFLWDFFNEATKAGLASLVQKGHLLTKVRLPMWLLVVASSSNAVITLFIFAVTILISLAVSGVVPAPVRVLLFVSYLAAFWLVVVGFSLASSVVFLRVRDLNQVWDLVLQGGFFVAPIIYPLGILPERLHWYLYWWPPTPVIQFARSVLVAGTIPTVKAHALLALQAVGVAVVGMLIFRWYAPRAAEYV